MYTEVTEACVRENNALKTKCRTIYAEFRNIAENVDSL